MIKKEINKVEIKKIEYHPPKSYLFDLEIFSASDFRHKGSQEKRRSPHAYMCYMIVCITGGSCIQQLDCEPIACETGSILIIKPGQTHSFGYDESWDGWIILFKPEYIQSSIAEVFEVGIRSALGNIPKHLRLNKTELSSLVDTLMQMKNDTKIDVHLQDINLLLRFQLYTLLTRLSIFNAMKVSRESVSVHSLRLFEHFRQLLEENFSRCHQVADFAHKLGCTEKSLTRATLGATGMNAKSLIDSRISLEAKRLLVHTDLSITLVSDGLGFEEVTNFIKYFKRINGLTPIAFRRAHWIYNDSLELKSK